MLQIQNASKFTADVGKLTIEDEDTPITNDGTLTLTGEGDFVHGLTSTTGRTGKFIVDGKIKAGTDFNGAHKIDNDITINKDKQLTVSISNIGGNSVLNNGTLDVVVAADDNLAANIVGNGTVKISGEGGTLTVDTPNGISSSQSVHVTSGNTFATDGNVKRLDGLKLEGNATLDMQNLDDNGKVKLETLTINSFTGPKGNGNVAKLKMDVAFNGYSTPANDQIVLNSAGTGQMGIQDQTDDITMGIRVQGTFGDENKVGETTTVTLIRGNVSSMSLSDKVVSYLGQYKYIFTRREGTGTYDVLKDYGASLKSVVNNLKNSGSEFYGLTSDYFAHMDEANTELPDSMGTLREITDGSPRDFTIDGNGHKYMGGANGDTDHQIGITVSETDVLTLEDMSEISRWEDYAVKNEGTFNLVHVDNLNSDILNDGGLNITGLGVLNGIIKQSGNTVGEENKATTNINTDLEVGYNGGIKQNVVTLANESKLVINTADKENEPVLVIAKEINGDGTLVVKQNIGIEAEKLKMKGGVTNDAVFTLKGTGNETEDGYNRNELTVKISGNGTTKIATDAYVTSSPENLGQEVEVLGTLNLKDGIIEQNIKGSGIINIGGGDGNNPVNITASQNLEIGTLKMDNGTLTMDSGKTLKADEINMNHASELILDRTNILNADKEILGGGKISSLIGKITMQNNSVVAIRLKDDETYTASDLKRLNSTGEGGIGEKTIFIGGKLIVDKEQEDIVIYGDIAGKEMTMEGIRPTIVAKKVNGEFVKEPDKIAPTEDQLTRTLNVVKNATDNKKVASVTPEELVTTINFTQDSQVGAKDLRVAKVDDITLVVGEESGEGNNKLTLVGTKNGIVVDTENNSVLTNVKVKENGLFELGNKDTDVKGNSGTLETVEVSTGTANVYNTVTNIKTLIVENNGNFWVDPATVIIDDLSFTGGVVGAETDGSVLSYKVNKETLKNALASADIDFSDTMGVKDGIGVLAIGEEVNLTGIDKKLGVSSDSSKITTPGLTLDKGSVLLVQTENGADAKIKVDSKDNIKIDQAGSRLIVAADDFEEGFKYNIICAENGQIGDAEHNILWQERNIYASDPLYRLVYDTDRTDFSNYVLRAVYNSVEAVYGVNSVVIPEVYNQILRNAIGSDANKWLKDVISDYGNGQTNNHRGAEMLNALANIGEAGATMHSTVTMINHYEQSIYQRLGINNRPSLLSPTTKYKMKNMVYDMGDIPLVENFVDDGYEAPVSSVNPVQPVEVGRQDDIMPMREYKDVQPKELWATYVGGKEKIDGLKLGGITAKSDVNIKGTTIGMDLWSNESSVAGIAAVYADGDVTGSSGGVSTKNDVKYYGAGIYERKDLSDDTAVIIEANYLHSSNEITQTNNRTEIKAKPKVDTYSASMRIEKSFGTENRYFTPYTGIQFTEMEGKSYKNDLGMKYGKQRAKIASIPLGFKMGANKETSGGWSLGPFIEAGYIFNIGDNKANMRIDYGGVTQKFGYELLDEDGCLFTNAGFVVRREGVAIQLGYTCMKGKHTRNNKFNVNMNFEY
ncbi:MAG: autotransporter outer membrane beta-barrel domain-containing protein [Phascolarctobacterium sp.]|nr:autotransporter outer membrane beta-barrel domain-containing protein [Candidatus Phascolarctobacterium caballi]